jgi:hypothetical protein
MIGVGLYRNFGAMKQNHHGSPAASSHAEDIGHLHCRSTKSDGPGYKRCKKGCMELKRCEGRKSTLKSLTRRTADTGAPATASQAWLHQDLTKNIIRIPPMTFTALL